MKAGAKQNTNESRGWSPVGEKKRSTVKYAYTRSRLFRFREFHHGVAGSKTVRHFGEGVAMTKEAVLELSVVEGREGIEDGGDLLQPGGNDITGKRDVADRGP